MQDYSHIKVQDPIISLLTHPKLKVLRHFFLLVLVLSIALAFVWGVIEKGVQISNFQKYFGILIFTSVFLGISYFNIYVLTPRFLMHNKWVSYFLSLSALSILLIIFIAVVQLYFFNVKNHIEEVNYFALLLQFISTFCSFVLLFTGITTLMLFKHWIMDTQQAKELESATMQLELQLLENQINPHFLFNMLNSANIMIKKDPDMSIHIIGKLEDMLRFLMNDSSREKVYLNEDISFLNDFLELEKTRRDYFSYTITQEGDSKDIQIPPLLFITFVENAVKHNLDSRNASYVNISFCISQDELTFLCENSIPKKSPVRETGGIGLKNIKRRLDLLYNNNYTLDQTKTDTTYNVKLKLKL